MTRSLLTFLLTLAFAAGASAQTTPKNSKTTTRTKAATRQQANASKTTSTGTMLEMPASTKGQTQSIYAAPGQPIVVPDGKVGPYDGKAAGRHATKSSTTLAPR